MRQRLNPKDRIAILERDNYTCQCCGHVGTEDSISRGMEVHHIMPCLFGGTNEPDNLTTLCPPCHLQYDLSAGTRNGTNPRKTPPILFNLTPITLKYLRELADLGYASQAEVIQMAVYRMHHQEIRRRR